MPVYNKVPNSITLIHYYRTSESDPLVENPHFLSAEVFARFLDPLSPMKDRLGPLMFRFEYLNRKKMASQSVDNHYGGSASLDDRKDRVTPATSMMPASRVGLS